MMNQKKLLISFFSEKELLNFLPQVGITIPKKFLKAEKLGLGYFEFNMHIPEELYKKHHKHNGKYRFKKADIAGLEINFYLGGQKIVLYSKKEIKPCKFTQLEDMYAHIIKTCKNESPHTAESHKLIAQAIKQHKLTQKTQSAQRLASRLMDDPSYHQLLKLNHLLLAYLTCAGLPTQYIQRLSDKLFLSDLINPLEKYSRNPVGEPPHLQCCATETLLQEFDAILNKLIELRPTLLLSPEVLNLQEMLQRLPVNTTMAGNSLPANISTPISSSFFQSAPIVNGAPKDVKSPQNGQQRRVPKH